MKKIQKFVSLDFFKSPTAFEKIILIGGGGVILFYIFFYLIVSFKDESSVVIDFSYARIGNIQNSISAVGEISPLQTIEVGSQLSGQVVDVFVDYNSLVEKDQVIAKIDPRTFSSLVEQAKADLKIVQANSNIQKASYQKAEINLEKAAKRFQRTKELASTGFASEQALDEAEQAHVEAQENIRIEKASLLRAEAEVQQRRELLSQREFDLLRADIRSPIKGVVIEKSIEIGQTVAASFQAPVLFKIAEDLHKMKVIVDVDEADVASIREGQKVVFSVDAFPERFFEGKVEQVRKAGVKKENIVTYTVIVTFEQEEILLLPGMTASVDIVQFEKSNVLLISNQALVLAKGYQHLLPPSAAIREDGWELIWVLNGDGSPELRKVLPNFTDEIDTEILEGSLQEGDRVVIGTFNGSFAEILENTD